MLRPYFFLCFLFFFAISVESFGQRVFWTEPNNNRIMVATLTPTGIVGTTTFKTGLNAPKDLAIDLAGTRIFYTDVFGEDIIEADLNTGAILSTVITTGGMVNFEDIAYSENTEALFGSMNTEVHGIFKVYADNNDSGGDINLLLSGNSNDDHLGISVDDGAEQFYTINLDNQGIYVSTDYSGDDVTLIHSDTGLEYIAVDAPNNKLYFTRLNGTNTNEIWTSALSGAGAAFLADVGGGEMQSIQVYPQFNKIYYVIRGQGLYSMNLNGSSNTLLVNLAGTDGSEVAIQADVTLPVFNDLNPADGASTVTVSNNFILTFGENVKVSSTAGVAAETSFRIYETSGNVLIETIDRSSANISIGGTTVTIDPTITLDYSKDYYILAGSKVISDLSANDWVGITGPSGWNFATEADQSIFYSRQNGAWNDPNTWSNTSHTGPAGTSLPGTGSDVIIGNGHTVTLTGNTDVQGNTTGTWIQAGGTLDAATFDFDVWGTLRIEGQFLNAGALSGTFNLYASGGIPIFDEIQYGVTGYANAPCNIYTNVVALNGIQSIDGGTINTNGFQICVPPTPPPVTPLFSNKTSSSLTLSWTSGGGNAFVVARQGSTGFKPAFGVAYTANAVFGSGSTVGTGNFVVYSGTGNSVTITGLAAGTDYEFDLYSFSTTIGGCYTVNSYQFASATSCTSLPAPSNPISAQYCPGNTKPAINVNSPGAGKRIRWYDAPIGGNLVAGDDTGGDGLGGVFIPTAASGTFYAETYDVTPECSSATRTAVTLTLSPALVPGSPSADQAICSGGDPTVIDGGTATGGTGTYTYEWESSSSAGGPFSAILGASQPTYDPPAGLTQSTYYRRRAKSGTCFAPGNPVAVAIVAEPVINSQPTAQQSCEGNSAAFTVAATGSSLQYQWQHDLGSGFTNITDGGVYAGALTNQLQITNTTGLNNVRFQCIVSVGGSCPVTSSAAPLTVNPIPVGSNQTQDVCETTAGTGIASVNLTAFNTSVTGGTVGLTVTWFTNAALTNAVPNPSNASANNNTVFYAKISNSSTGCSGSATVTITVNKKPSGAGNISGVLALCTVTPATFTVNGITNAQGYQWQVTSGLEILSETGTTVSIQATSGASGTITVTGENSCGSGGSASLPIQILMAPDIQIVAPQETLIGEPASFSFEPSSASFETILWNFGDNATSSESAPTHLFASEGTYQVTLEVSDNSNCTSVDEVSVSISPIPELGETNIKNVITANGDSKNGVLYIENIEKYPLNQVVLLDRWGVEVFKKDNYVNDWDARRNGEFLPAGQYVCIVKLNETGKIFTRTVSIIKRK